ncbi:MAG: TIGR04211 family SH3 domain-containing protein [Polyangiaceae bacterium]
MARRARSLAFLFLFIVAIVAIALPSASANLGWVRGNIRLNLRAGAGTEFKILSGVETGDKLEVLSTSENWTRVRTPDGQTGWIPAGYLETKPPATIRLATLESETEALREELESLRSEASKLRESNLTLNASQSGQQQEIESLKVDNYELHVGTRYQGWITGALILAIGMILGGALHRNATRRPSSRIRL